MTIRRTSLVISLFGAALSAHADLVPLHGFDEAFDPGPISISTGTDRADAFTGNFYTYVDATVDSNADASGLQRLTALDESSQLWFDTGPDVDGSLKITLYHATYSGPFGYLGYDLGRSFAALHLDFGLLDHDATVSYSGAGESGEELQAPGSFTGAATVAAGTTAIDIPLATSTGRVSRLQNLIVDIDVPAGASFRLNGIGAQAVPEPASFVALGLGAIALRRRSRPR